MTVDEQRIRALAYQIWESEGCPEGQEQRHWLMASKLAAAADAPAASVPVKRTRKVKAPDGVSEPASRKKAGTAKAPLEKPALLKTPKKTGRMEGVGKPIE
ncbi:MAG: DUF2934 domain-containing protein [Pseudomonadota bacterium]